MRTGFKYTVKYVEHKNTSKGTLTKFSAGEKIKDSEKYANWHCVSFEQLDIQDNDRIVIDSIDSIDVREYQGKTFYDLVVKAHKLVDIPQAVSTENPFDI